MVAVRVLTAVAAAGLLVGCGADADGDQVAGRTTASSSTVTAPSVDPQVQVECSNVERAYNAWYWEPVSSADWAQFQVSRRQDQGEDFHDAVVGYSDPAAVDLVVAIADYNLELAFVSANYVAVGSADTADAEDARVAVVDAYEAFQSTTCDA
jgi:hypothetical protein